MPPINSKEEKQFPFQTEVEGHNIVSWSKRRGTKLSEVKVSWTSFRPLLAETQDVCVPWVGAVFLEISVRMRLGQRY